MKPSRNSLLSAALLICPFLAASAEPFSFDTLREKARDLAAKPFVAEKSNLADYWANLTYDQHRDIRFKMESGLWWGK